MNASFVSLRPREQNYGFSSTEVRQSARRQLEISTIILTCFGIGCALAFAI